MGSSCTHEHEQSHKKVYNLDQAKAKPNNELAITTYLKRSETKDRAVVKILLLGSGSSGKSTLFRQIDHLHGDKSPRQSIGHSRLRSKNTMHFCRRAIRANCITALFKLLKQSLVLAEEPYKLEDVRVAIDTEETECAIRLLAQWAKQVTDDPLESELTALGRAMAHLWEKPGVRATFRHRHYYSLIENADFFSGPRRRGDGRDVRAVDGALDQSANAHPRHYRGELYDPARGH